MIKSNDLVITNYEDNVGIAIRELKKGEEISAGQQTIKVKDDIQIPQKIALRDIEIGEQIIKYGSSIGTAVAKIAQGELVHLHNIHSNLENEIKYVFAPEKASQSRPLLTDKITFKGYVRESGEVGTRNNIFILPSVFCANGFASRLARIANEIYPKGENFDGFISLSHFSGCCEEGHNLKSTQGSGRR